MKLISSFMSFFGKQKIYAGDNESALIVNLQHNISIKPAPALCISNDCDNTCFISRHNDDPSYVREMINPPVMIRLNSDRRMPNVACFGDHRINYLDLRFFSGVFAFLIFKDEPGNQFLAIKRLDNYDSNHSVLSLFARRGRLGDELKTAKIICGGEVVLNQGCIERWNLKSGGYSQNTEFDEYKNPNIQEAIASLWFPMQDKFRSIKESDEHLQEKYTPKGSFRLGSVDNSPFEARRPAASPRDPEIDRNGSRGLAAGRRDLNCQQTLASTLFKTSSDKTVESEFDHDHQLTNQASQITLPYRACA